MPRGAPRLRTPDNKINQARGRVREQRAASKLTQDGLCARLAFVTGGVERRRAGDLPDREGRAHRVGLGSLALARALDCDPCWLLWGTGEPAGPSRGAPYRDIT